MLQGLLAKATNTNTQEVKATDTWAVAKDKMELKMQLLEALWLGVQMINHPSNTDAMVRQNQRIWSRL
jgi:hypothetical protein